MNFTEGGGYTMDLINAWYGPNVFFALCGAIGLLSWAVFLVKGWVEPPQNYIFRCFLGRSTLFPSKQFNAFSSSNAANQQLQSPQVTPQSRETYAVALIEEEKRRNEALRKRKTTKLMVSLFVIIFRLLPLYQSPCSLCCRGWKGNPSHQCQTSHLREA